MTGSARGAPLQASLHELGLQSEQPDRLADFYGKGLGYRFSSNVAAGRGVARERRVAIQEGLAKTLAYAAYAVPDRAVTDALEARLAAAGVAVERVAMEGYDGDVTVFRDPDGNQFRFGVAVPESWETADSASARSARLQHVVFATTDIDRMLSFFTQVVGFTLSDRVEDARGSLRTFFVRGDHEHHNLAVFAADECRLDHHCYEAADWGLIRDWADHFAKLRIPLKWGPGRHGPGNNLFLFVHDPDGNWLEISAELEQVEPDRKVGVWPHEEYTLNSWGAGFLRS